jgi:hypothetical protein
MLVGFFNLNSHLQNTSSREFSMFSTDLSCLNLAEDELGYNNFVPAYRELSNAGKFGKASASALGFNITMGTLLFLSLESFTNWSKDDKLRIESILNQYGESYSNPPVID